MLWFMLIFSLTTLGFGVYSIKWHSELYNELERGNSYTVDILDYLLSFLGAYFVTPASVACIVISIVLSIL